MYGIVCIAYLFLPSLFLNGFFYLVISMIYVKIFKHFILSVIRGPSLGRDTASACKRDGVGVNFPLGKNVCKARRSVTHNASKGGKRKRSVLTLGSHGSSDTL